MALPSNIKPGMIVRFTYLPSVAPGAAADPDQHGDRFKEAMVLNPSWQGKVHGIDLRVLTPAQREVLDALFDPEKADRPHRLPLVNDIRARMDVLQEIKNPVTFYAKLVKPLLLTLGDCYRTYWPARMSGVTVAQPTAVQGPMRDPASLVPREAQKGTEPTKPLQANRPRADVKAAEERAQQQAKPVDRVELLRQRQAALRAEKERKQGTTAAPPALDRQGRLAAIKARSEKLKKERPR